MIGKGLGMMKDELMGGVIIKFYILGIKQYGYCITQNNNIIFFFNYNTIKQIINNFLKSLFDKNKRR